MKTPWFFPALLFCLLLLAGSASALTTISDCAGLQAMNNKLDEDYVLGKNIDCDVPPFNSGVGFKPIGYIASFPVGEQPFTGSFDGKGFEITGLKINRPAEGFVGLFGITRNADIRRVKLSGVDIAGSSYVGALVGSSVESTITCASSTGTVSGSSFVGGLVGENAGGTIAKSSSAANIAGSVAVGGFVGVNNNTDPGGGSLSTAKISDSFARGNVSGANNVGGFAGYSSGAGPVSNEITNSYSTGQVTALTNAGGFLGADPFTLGTCDGCFWDSSALTPPASACGTSKTTVEMQKASTFTAASWDTAIWNIADGSSPSLKMADAVCSASGPATGVFSIASCALSPVSAEPNGSVTATVEVINDGGEAGAIVEAGIKGLETGSSGELTIPGGEKKTFSVDFHVPGALEEGNYEVWVNVFGQPGQLCRRLTVFSAKPVPVPELGVLLLPLVACAVLAVLFFAGR